MNVTPDNNSLMIVVLRIFGLRPGPEKDKKPTLTLLNNSANKPEREQIYYMK